MQQVDVHHETDIWGKQLNTDPFFLIEVDMFFIVLDDTLLIIIYDMSTA